MEPHTMRLQVTVRRRRAAANGKWGKKNLPDAVTMTLIGTRIRNGSSKTRMVELFRCPVTIEANQESIDVTRYYSLPADGISLDEFWVEVERTTGVSPVTVLYNICTQPVEDEVGPATPEKSENHPAPVEADTAPEVVAEPAPPPKAVAKVREEPTTAQKTPSSEDDEAYNSWLTEDAVS